VKRQTVNPQVGHDIFNIVTPSFWPQSRSQQTCY